MAYAPLQCFSSISRHLAQTYQLDPGEVSYTVRNDVRVSVEGSLWVSVCGVIAGQVPDDQGLVAGGGQEHVWAKPACQHHPPSA